MKYKNFSRLMNKELTDKVKINTAEYGYCKNTPDIIELIHRVSGKHITINKKDYNLTF